MSANEIDTFVLLFDDPNNDESTLDGKVKLNATIGFDLFLGDNLRTLSTNTVSNGDFLQGLLYVPTLLSNDPCNKQLATYVPQNVTRLSDLPGPEDAYYIAILPWTKECIAPYLDTANTDRVSAFITYIPDNGTDTPPLENSPQWSLGDGGHWKSQNKFPVYAIPGAWGFEIMQALGRYSGSLKEAPDGDALLKEGYHSTDYVRLFTSIQTQAASQLPNLWTFLLIVLGIILLLMFLTSCAMHYHQRRRRRDLERRIRSGEVNLESMGVKRMAVPKEILDTIPLTTYSPGGTAAGSNPSDSPEPCFDQQSCVICLDDFVAKETRVRTLPCQHIFHPECVDQLLLKHSSLCPTCKAPVLPKGYCPVKITNVMVRRERMARRFGDVERLHQAHAGGRRRHDASSNGRYLVGGNIRLLNFYRRLGFWNRQRQNTSRSPTSTAMEMMQPSSSACPPPPAPPQPAPVSSDCTNPSAAAANPPPVAVQTADRSERARTRIGTLLGRNPSAHAIITDGATMGADVAEDEDRRPKWRKIVGGVFPGFR